MLLKWFFGSDVSNTRSESRASLAAALMALCMLSAPFSRGFPEKGMACCGVHYSCAKAFMCAPQRPVGRLWPGWACSGTRAWTGMAAETFHRMVELEPSLWGKFSPHSLDRGLCLP